VRGRDQARPDVLHDCSFCGERTLAVDIVQGPMVRICRTCVSLCRDILHADEGDPRLALDAARNALASRAHASQMTALRHPDPAQRHDAAVRRDAYRCALLDVEAAAKMTTKEGS
jgi:hypothetical protein